MVKKRSRRRKRRNRNEITFSVFLFLAAFVIAASLTVSMSVLPSFIKPRAATGFGTVEGPGEKIIYVDNGKGNDNWPGTKFQPVKTISKGIDLLKGLGSEMPGAILEIREGVYENWDDPPYYTKNRVRVVGVHGTPNEWVTIRGEEGKEVIIKGWKEYIPTETEPTMLNPAPYNPNAVMVISESSYLVVQDLYIEGGGMATTEIGTMNPTGATTHHIDILRVTSIKSGSRGAFVGGVGTHNIALLSSTFGDTINSGGSSHGVYFTGGHWTPGEPALSNIVIKNSEFYGNSRWGIQFNGKFEGIHMENNAFHHNDIGGFSFIGVQNAVVTNNIIYSSNKQGGQIYMYVDKNYWDPNDPESVEHWKSTHWTNKNILIANNIINMPEKPWIDLHKYNPQHHAGILFSLTQELRDMVPDFPEFTNIKILNNVVAGYSGMFISSWGSTDLNAEGNEFYRNIAYNYFGGEENMYICNGYNYVSGKCEYDEGDVYDYQKTHKNWFENYKMDPLHKKITPTETIITNGGLIKIDFSDIFIPYRKDAGNDFHYQVGSPAIDHGSLVYYPEYDFDFVSRPVGPRTDIGAYEEL